MEAIILAGGFGTRLKGLISGIPKPMAPVNNRPFLEYLLNFLKKNNIKAVVLSVGYLSEVIINHFDKKYNTIEINYAVEKEALGTGGAINLALQYIKGDSFFLLNGDTFFDIDLMQLKDFYISSNADIAIALKEMNNFERYGTVMCEKEQIVKFEEKKKCSKGIINGGIYCIKKTLFSKLHNMPLKYSFEKDILEKHLGDLRINGLMFNDYFIDIGVPEDFSRAKSDFVKMQY